LSDSPPPTNPPSPQQPKSIADSEDSYVEDLLKDFDSFDTFEKLANENFLKEDYDFKPKRVKFDSESDEFMIQNDCMWNPNFDNIIQDIEQNTTENIIKGINNDHSYAANTDIDVKINFEKIQKKTKILVPLKHLMETLQQKSYLVSPLGPGKKVIRLTGSETVKG